MDMGTNESVLNKLNFIRAELGLSKTFIDLAKTEKRLGNVEHFERLQGHITQSLETIGRMLADERIIISDADAAGLRVKMESLRAEYHAL